MIEFALILGVIGLAFIYIEFFLPGGLIGIVGGTLLLLSLVLVGIKGSTGWLIFYLVTLIVLLLVLVKVALAHVKRSNKSIYLDQDQEGYVASHWHKEMVGKEGESASQLNPSGHVFVDGQYLQAISRTGFIKKGAPIKIVGGQGAHYLVEPQKK